MKRPKFKIWDTKEKKWFEPILEAYRGKLDDLLISTKGDLLRQTMQGLDHESLFPDRYIVVESIGRSDSKNVELFNGDLLIFKGDMEAIYEVFYNDDEARYSCNRTHYKDSRCGGYIPPLNSPNLEKVGSIHDNPELLEQKDV